MLNQDERRRFNDIAHHLTADREFARQAQAYLPAEGRRYSTLSVLCALLTITAPIPVLVGGWITVPFVLALFVVVAVVLRRRRRRTT